MRSGLRLVSVQYEGGVATFGESISVRVLKMKVYDRSPAGKKIEEAAK